MKLMLIHLSDIHIVSEEDAVTNRYSQIVNAVRNLDYSLDMCVVVVTGDVAFSGTDEQYLIAWEFLDSVKKQLAEHLSESSGNNSVPIHIVVVPGNHDCDFTAGGEVRGILVNSILDNPSKSSVSDIVQVCTGVQASFFDFLNAVEPSPRVPSNQDYDITLCYEYSLSHGNECIKFVCYNTAWLSRLHESQGHLFFPSKAVTNGQDGFDLVVAAFHHPYNWIESNAARSFRDRIEATSDLILTGHEHIASMKVQDGHLGQHNVCVEGGVLQDNNDPTLSTFNVFIFDTSLRKQKFGHFTWKEDAYILTDGSSFGDEGSGLGWTDYQVNNLRAIDNFQLSDSMRRYLNDPGINLHHRDRGLLNLRDVFLYPDLTEIRTRGERFGQRVSGEYVRDLLSPSCKLLITGDTESGKTCLAKMLYLEFLAKGIIPVFLDANIRPPSGDRIFGHIDRLFSEQYSSGLLQAYRQLDKSCRAS